MKSLSVCAATLALGLMAIAPARGEPAEPAKAPKPPVYSVSKEPDPEPAAPVRRKGPLPLLTQASADGTTLFFSGSIEAGDNAVLRRLIAANPRAKALHITSHGGLVMEARLMAGQVTRAGLSVHVEQICASACTIILAAGKERSIGPHARLGFHRPGFLSVNGDPTNNDTSSIKNPAPTSRERAGDAQVEEPAASGKRAVADTLGMAIVRSALRQAGVDEDFIDRGLATPFTTMWYPDVETLLASHMIDRRIPEEQRVLPSYGVTRADIAASLDTPFWSVLAEKRPELSKRAIDAVWTARNLGLKERGARSAALALASDELLLEAMAAPDATIERLIDVQARSALLARSGDYAVCKVEDFTADSFDVGLSDLNEVIEAAYFDLLAAPRTAKVMPPEKAERLIGHFVVFDMAVDDSFFGSGSTSDDCIAGMKLFEAIGSTPRKQRIKLFRAMLVLIAQEEAEKQSSLQAAAFD